MNATTMSRPARAAAQKSAPGRSPARATAASAVAAGSRATTTAPCWDSLVTSARPVSSGKPTTAPPATSASRRHCAAGRAAAPGRRAGRARPAPRRRPRARTSRTTDRDPATARRVAGSENENPRTPSSPSTSPRSVALPAGALIALLVALMTEDNAFDRVAEDLRATAVASAPGRAPAVGPRADGAPPRRPADRPARDRPAGRGGSRRPPPGPRHVRRRPGGRARAPAPDLDWQALALGEGAADASALHAQMRLPPPGAIVLSSGYPDESLQPTGLLAAALARAARRPGAWARVPTEGVDRLRAWFALRGRAACSAHTTSSSRRARRPRCRR